MTTLTNERFGRLENSLLAKQKIVIALAQKLDHERPIYFYLVKDFKQAREVWREIIKLTPSWWLKSTFSTGAPRIVTTLGSELYILPLGQESTFYGVQFDGGIIDTEVDSDTYFYRILPTLSHRHGWCLSVTCE